MAPGEPHNSRKPRFFAVVCGVRDPQLPPHTTAWWEVWLLVSQERGIGGPGDSSSLRPPLLEIPRLWFLSTPEARSPT